MRFEILFSYFSGSTISTRFNVSVIILVFKTLVGLRFFGVMILQNDEFELRVTCLSYAHKINIKLVTLKLVTPKIGIVNNTSLLLNLKGNM